MGRGHAMGNVFLSWLRLGVVRAHSHALFLFLSPPLLVCPPTLSMNRMKKGPLRRHPVFTPPHDPLSFGHKQRGVHSPFIST